MNQDVGNDLKDKVVADGSEQKGQAEGAPPGGKQPPPASEQEAEPKPEAEQLLKQQLAALQGEKEQLYNRYLRLAADFENYRRRTRQEVEEIRRTAAERLLVELLPLADNFERAIASVRSELPEKVITGIEMIHRQFLNILSQAGVEPMEAVGKPFDPAYHEAFEEVTTDEWPEGTVASEVQKGYLLSGKVLRPALVRVAKASHADDQQGQEECLDKEDDKDE